MNVTILTEGGKRIGFGHITRCHSLHQAFLERNIVPEFIVNGESDISSQLKKMSFKTLNWLKEKQELDEAIKNTKILIVDSYRANRDFYGFVSKRVEITAYLDDNKRIEYPRGVVINGNIYAQALNYPKQKDIAYLLGSAYFPLRNEFLRVILKKVKRGISNILVTFGGTEDIEEITSKVLKFLCENFPEKKKTIVLKQGFRGVRELRRTGDPNTRIISCADADSMKKVMQGADLAISAGGVTLYELARMAVPTIGICIAQNQLLNLKGWEKAGFLTYIGRHNEKNLLRNLVRAIHSLEDQAVRSYRSRVGVNFVDGRGSQRVVNDLLSRYYRNNISFRNCVLRDARKIFQLANDREVRNNSFNPSVITWERHIAWLKQKLQEPRCVFYAVDILGAFQGQVRFDVNGKGDQAIISISIKKDIRGLGLSSFIIDKAVKEFAPKFSGIKQVMAYVKERNIISAKSFEGAGFQLLKKKNIKGVKARIYVRKLK